MRHTQFAPLATGETPDAQSGFTTVEMALAASSIVVGLLSYVGSVIASSKMSLDTRARTAANVEMTTAIEEFRELAAADFVGTTGGLADLETKEGLSTIDGIKVHRQVILDETKIQPPLDLNGDGDTTDTNLTAADVNAAYLVTTVTWVGPSGQRSVSWPTVIARGEVEPDWRQNKALEEEGEDDAQDDRDDADELTEPTALQAEGSFGNGAVSGQFELGGTSGQGVYIVGVTFVTDVSAKVRSITINGETAYSAGWTKPSVNTLIETSPFALTEGANSIDGIVLSPSSWRDDEPELAGETVSVVFHTEDGNTVPVQLKLGS